MLFCRFVDLLSLLTILLWQVFEYEETRSIYMQGLERHSETFQIDFKEGLTTTVEHFDHQSNPLGTSMTMTVLIIGHTSSL